MRHLATTRRPPVSVPYASADASGHIGGPSAPSSNASADAYLSVISAGLALLETPCGYIGFWVGGRAGVGRRVSAVKWRRKHAMAVVTPKGTREEAPDARSSGMLPRQASHLWPQCPGRKATPPTFVMRVPLVLYRHHGDTWEAEAD